MTSERIDLSSPSLAWALLFTGLGYALPFALFPAAYPPWATFGTGILNLYCLVAWMGLSHFVYAFRGQFLTAKKPDFPKYRFLVWLLVGAIGLILLRSLLGWMLFSFVMWIYFIPHFIHALNHFNKTLNPSTLKAGASLYWFPTLSFAIFTFALFGLHHVALGWQPWLLVTLVLGGVLLGWVGGVFNQLRQQNFSSIILLAFVLLTEALIWGTYSQFMHPQFRQGIYIVHVAMASFYHYFRSYAFAQQKSAGSPWLSFLSIAGINLCLIGVGSMVLHQKPLQALLIFFGIPWFTFWVGFHQYASNLFNLITIKPSRPL